MQIFVMIAAVVLAGLLFFSLSPRTDDASKALRKLLLARAGGELTAEEFELRQSALHEALLMPADSKFSMRRLLLPASVMAMAVALYAWLGHPQMPDVSPPVSTPSLSSTGTPEPGQPAVKAGDLREMAKRLAEKLAQNPANGEGWALLGHSYVELHMNAEAAEAFSKAAAILPPNAGLLSDWADAYVLSHNREWDQHAREIVERALAADPKHLKALALAGSEAFDRADYNGAISFWRRMKTAAPADSMDAKLADANMQEAATLMSGKVSKITKTDQSGAASDAIITGTVSLSPELKRTVNASDTVFVVAKVRDGAGPPLAVRRFSVGDLPTTFRLDDSSAMVPGRTLSVFPEALLLARVSRSGNAIPQTGDVQTPPILVKVGAKNVSLELGR